MSKIKINLLFNFINSTGRLQPHASFIHFRVYLAHAASPLYNLIKCLNDSASL